MTWYTTQTQNELIAKLNNQALTVLDFSSYEGLQYVDVSPVVLAGHTDTVVGIAVLPNGQVVSTSVDNTLRVWDINSGVCVKVLNGHTDNVYGVAVLPNNHVVSTSEDKTLRIWDVSDGACVKVLTGHTDTVYSIAVLPNGQVVSGSFDNTLRVWDINSGTCVKVLTGHTDRVADVAVLPNNHVVSTSRDKTLRVWDVSDGACVKVLDGHTDTVVGIAVLPNGQVVSTSVDNTLRVWDINSGVCVKVLNGHTDNVYDVAVLPNGQVMSTSVDNTLRIWDVSDGACVKVLKKMEGHTHYSYSIAVLPNGQVVSTEDNALRVWTALPRLSYEIIAPVLTAITPVSTLNILCCQGVELGQAGYAHVLRLAKTVPSLRVINVSDTDLTVNQATEIQRALQGKQPLQNYQELIVAFQQRVWMDLDCIYSAITRIEEIRTPLLIPIVIPPHPGSPPTSASAFHIFAVWRLQAEYDSQLEAWRDGQQNPDKYHSKENERQRKLLYYKPIIAALSASAYLLEKSRVATSPIDEVKYQLLDKMYTQVLRNLKPYQHKENIGQIFSKLNLTLEEMRLEYHRLNKTVRLPYIPQTGISLASIGAGGIMLSGAIPALDETTYQLIGAAVLLAGTYSIGQQVQNGVVRHSENLDVLLKSAIDSMGQISDTVTVGMSDIIEISSLEARIANNRFSLFASRAEKNLADMNETLDRNMKALVNKIEVDVKVRHYSVCNLV